MSKLSASSVKQRTAALNLFNRFLYMEKLPEFDELKKEELNAAVFSKFASYLYRYEDRVKHSSTALSYFSQVVTHVREKFKADVFKGEEILITRIRKNLGRQFDERLERNGIPSVGHAEGVNEDAIEFSVECLFNPCVGKFGAIQRRAAERLMLCLDRSLVGRISEIRGISFSQIVFADQQGCLMVCLIFVVHIIVNAVVVD